MATAQHGTARLGQAMARPGEATPGVAMAKLGQAMPRQLHTRMKGNKLDRPNSCGIIDPVPNSSSHTGTALVGIRGLGVAPNRKERQTLWNSRSTRIES
jgi:hypothetical protein